MVLLKLGDRGVDVTRLQSLLNHQTDHAFEVTEDGIFGPRTQEAVQRFQMRQQLTPDGLVQSRTWRALKQGADFSGDLDAPVWMNFAKREMGVTQVSEGSELDPRVEAYHRSHGARRVDVSTPWSSAFLNWVLHQSGYSGTRDLDPKGWLNWGLGLNSPKRGAVVVLRRKGALGPDRWDSLHVGFLEQQQSTRVRLLGGDQDNEVSEKEFSLRDYQVMAYRWPLPKQRYH